MRAWVRYAALSASLGGLVVAGGWVFLPEELGQALALAVGVVLPVQMIAFAALTRWAPGTRRFLAAWVGGMLLRLAAVGVTAMAVAGREASELLTTLLTMVGLFLLLLLLEPWALRKWERHETNG